MYFGCCQSWGYKNTITTPVILWSHWYFNPNSIKECKVLGQSSGCGVNRFRLSECLQD